MERVRRANSNTREPAGADLQRTSLVIFMSDSLPPMCYHCGCDTDRNACVVARRRQDAQAPSQTMALLTTVLSFVFLPFTVLWPRSSGTLEVSLQVPQCAACAAAMGKPKPQFVNLNSDSMTFLVDRRFKEQVVRERV